MTNLRQTFRGYLYQDLATAIQFVRSLLGQIDRTSPEVKLNSTDVFDDLLVYKRQQRLKYQFKHSSDNHRVIEPKDFRTNRSKIRIDRVCYCIKALAHLKSTEYRICATWGEPGDSALKGILVPDLFVGTFPGHRTQVFSIDLEQLWPLGKSLLWPAVSSKQLTRRDYRRMCERLRIELNCPPMSANLENPGPAEILLLRLLSEEVGIGRFPNLHLRPLDVAGRLIYEAAAARATGRSLARKDIVSILRLRMDYGRVAQKFPVKWEEAIDFADIRKNLKDLTMIHRCLLVTGPPGSGKSWALTRLAEDMRSDGVAVGRHYCYVSVNDADAPLRVRTETLYANLTDSLIQAVPELAHLNRPLYASGPNEFKTLLESANKKYPGKRIVLIVDGLDHIARIRSQHDEISVADSNIVDELANLQLPENVSLVLGSQPGNHLAGLRKHTSPLSLPAWSKAETLRFLSRIGLARILAANAIATTVAKPLFDAIHGKAHGNPLYTWYLVKEVRRALERQDARAPTDIVAAAPIYDEHLTQYYTHLISAVKQPGESLAGILACVDFSLTREQLNEIGGPWTAQLLGPAIESLHPVLDETASHGGIRIYHDSFRRFMLERIGDTTKIAEILKPVISWLKNRGFLEDALAFRFLVPCLRRARLDQEMMDRVKPTFVSEAIGAGHSRTAIALNLKQMAETAIRVNDLPKVAAIVELHKATITAFEDNLQFQINQYGSAFAAIHGGVALAERLVFDGKPTLGVEDGLLLCRICDLDGTAAPWAEYLALGKINHKNDGWENLAVAEFTGAVRLRGFETILPGIKGLLTAKREYSGEYLEGILQEIGRMEGQAGLAQLASLRFGQNSTAVAVYLHYAKSCYQANRKREYHRYLLKAASRVRTAAWLARCIDSGLGRRAARACIRAMPHLQLQPPPVLDHTNIRSQHEEWTALVRAHAFVQNPGLSELRAKINAPGWYHAWLRFVIDVCEGSALPPPASGSTILKAFHELASYKNPFEGSPRACDLYQLHDAIAGAFERALTNIQTANDWAEALATLEEISSNTSTHIGGERGFNGPLSSESLARLLTKFIGRKDVVHLTLARLAATAAMVENKGEYYSVVASHYYGLALALAQFGDKEGALRAWRYASRAICGYGWRKDPTVWELFQSAPLLAQFGPSRAELILQNSQQFADAVLLHTDGRETKRAPNGWFRALVETNPIHAAIVLARSISNGGGTWQWQWETAIKDLLEKIQDDADPRVTFLLDFIRPWDAPKEQPNYDRVTIMSRLARFPLFSQTASKWSAAKLQDEPFPSNAGSPELLSGVANDPQPESRASELASAVQFIPADTGNVIETGLNEEILPALSGASPLEILNVIRRRPGELDGKKRLLAMSGRLGNRLTELLRLGDAENVTRILMALSGEWWYGGAGDILTALAEGFEKRQYMRAAAEAYTIAALGYSPERNGPDLLSRAVKLDKKRVMQIATEIYVRKLDQGWVTDGIPAQLINLALAIGDPELAFRIRDETAAIIEERLWSHDHRILVFSEYRQKEIPRATLDEALCYLIVARANHPENLRRLSGLAAIAAMLRENFIPLVWGIDQYLRCNAFTTTTTAIMELIWHVEPPGYEISRRLHEILDQMAGSDQFSIAILSRRLLQRAGKRNSSEPRVLLRSIVIPLSSPRVDLILSLDTQGRLEHLDKAWPGCGRYIASEFEQLFSSSDCHKDRMRDRWDASRDRVYPERPLTQVHPWETELFELVLQRFLSGMRWELFGRGLWDKEYEEKLLSLASPGTIPHVLRFMTRIPRPTIPMPSEVQDCYGGPLAEVIADLPGSWFRVALFERQISLPEPGASKIAKQTSLFSGLVSAAQLCNINPSERPPVGQGNWKAMWNIPAPAPAQTALRWKGPLAWFDFSDSCLGCYPFLGLFPDNLNMFGLASRPTDQMVLVDANGEVAVQFRSWWTLSVTEWSERGNQELMGCELLVRSDILQTIKRLASHDPSLVTCVRQIPLHAEQV